MATASPTLVSPPRPQAAAPVISIERRLSAWILIMSLGCLTALALPFLFGQVYVADDLGAFHLPIRDFYSRQLAIGEAFDWMPSLYGGFYIAAEGQLGAYHPCHLFLYRLLPLGVAFDLELLASYPLLFAGTFWFLRRAIGQRDAALFGALTFTFGGFSLLHFIHPNAIAVVAHLPWLLVAIDVALSAQDRRTRALAEAGIALLTASQLLLGYPQYVWFSLLAEASFAVWRLRGRGPQWHRVTGIAIAGLAGVLMGAMQWVPTWHLLGESARSSANADFSNTGSLHPLNLVQLVAPYLFATRVAGQNTHELGLYLGAVPLVLCVWLVAQRRQWGAYRPLIIALLAFAGFALLLAMGEHGGIYRLQALVPVLNRFRFPCRAIVLVQFCLAGGAAVAAAMLFAQFDKPRAIQPSPTSRSVLLWVFIASVVVALIGPLLWPDFVARPILIAVGPLLLGTAALLVTFAERGARWAAFVLIALTAVDLTTYGLSYSVYQRTAKLADFVAATNRPPGSDPLRVAMPTGPTGLRPGNRILLTGVTRVDGYAGLEPAKQRESNQTNAWRLAGAEWVLMQPTSANEQSTWQRVSNPMARARLIDPEAAASDSIEPTNDQTVRVLHDAPGHIEVDATTDVPRTLVTTESYDSGWVATIDGVPVAVVRVEGDFLGCPIPTGKHRVQLEFRPASRHMGGLLAACGLGLMVAGISFRLSWRPWRAAKELGCRDLN